MNLTRSTCPTRSRAPRGFTLIEVMVVIAIAGVLMALAIPGMQGMIAGRAVAAQGEELIGALHYARAEAIKRGGPVTICRTTAAAPDTCATTSSGTWQYWMVFAETPATFNGIYAAPDMRLRVQSTPPGKVNYETVTPKYFSFQATGIVITANSTDLPIRLKLLPNLPTSSSSYLRYQRHICLNRQGRASVVDASGTCTV